MSKEDLIPVARVTIVHNGRVHEIPRCWISIQTGGEVEIWLSPRQESPLLRLPLADVTIDWPDLEVSM